LLTGFVPGTRHTITFKYETTKGGKHAYDFLTTWDWSEDWIVLADHCQTITGCTTAGETAAVTATTTAPPAPASLYRHQTQPEYQYDAKSIQR